MVNELVVARVVSQDMGLGELPHPGIRDASARREDVAPWQLTSLVLGPRQLDGDGLERAVLGEEEERARAVQRRVLLLAHLVHVRQQRVVVVQHEQLLLLNGLMEQFNFDTKQKGFIIYLCFPNL